MDELNDDTGSTSTDLTPRIPPAARRRRKRPWALLALVAVVVALLVVVFNGLGDATLFFRNADEAVAQRESLDDRRFRIQGRVAADSIVPTDTGVDFVIAWNDVDVAIVHQGDPPDLFQGNIPVVLEGHWAQVGDGSAAIPADAAVTDDGWYFVSDRFFVKHEEVYVEENPDRVTDYDEAPADETPAGETSADETSADETDSEGS
jgi:cytochrome c-type biogenesis protein CcmE